MNTPMLLMVDDESPVLELLSRILTRRGYRVCSALDGKQALEVAEDNQPDLILLDVEMPA